jgi:anti-anti-sigma factor
MKLEKENFTVYETEELKEQIVHLIEQNDSFELDLENIIKIDMSGIQLLISVKKSCDKKNIPFKIINIDDVLLKSFQICGCDTVLGL